MRQESRLRTEGNSSHGMGLVHRRSYKYPCDDDNDIDKKVIPVEKVTCTTLRLARVVQELT